MYETVTARLPKPDIDLLDRLIKMGYFTNRSEAIRIIVSKELKEIVKREIKGEIQKKLDKKSVLTDEKLMDYSKKLFPLVVADIVAEGRDR